MLNKGDEPIPGYRIEAFLGRGQFGEVWRATSPGDVPIALKFLNIQDRHGLTELRSTQHIKKIRHPHLVPVIGLWLLNDSGQVLSESQFQNVEKTDLLGGELQRETMIPSLSHTVPVEEMPSRLIVATLLCGQNLKQRLEDCLQQGWKGIPYGELVVMMQEAAKGIDYLNSPQHDLGDGPVAIQHCDIKPANIMLMGEAAMIGDFGVARLFHDQAATATSMAGSPAFMAPESIERKPAATSDQYSLAITYYELRTGELPFRSESMLDVIEAKRQGQLDLSLLPTAEREVIAKATAVDPADRFASCQEMIAALSCEKETVFQRPSAPLAGLKRINRLLAVGAVAVLIAGVMLGLFGSDIEPDVGGDVSSPVEITFQVDPADAEVRIDGEKVVVDSQGRVVLMRKPTAGVKVVISKRPHFKDWSRDYQAADLAGQRMVLESDQSQVDLVARGHAQAAWAAIDTDAAHLPRLAEAVQEYQRAIEIDQKKYSQVPSLHHLLNEPEKDRYTLHALRLLTAREWLVGRFDGNQVAFWNLGLPANPRQTIHTQNDGASERSDVCNLLVSGDYVISAGVSESICISQMDAQGAVIETVRPGKLAGWALASTMDSRWLIVGNLDGQLYRWDLHVRDAAASPVLIGRHDEPIHEVLITPDDRWVVSADLAGHVKQWSLSDPNPATAAKALGKQEGELAALAMSQDGQWLAWGGEARQGSEYPISLCQRTDATSRVLTEGHVDAISALCFGSGVTSADTAPQYLASGSVSGDVHLWNLAEGSHQPLVSQHDGSVRSLTFLPIAGWLASGGDDGNLHLWNYLAPTTSPLVLKGGSGRIAQVLVTARWLIAGCNNGAILVWDLRRCILVKQACDALEIPVAAPSDMKPRVSS